MKNIRDLTVLLQIMDILIVYYEWRELINGYKNALC